MRVNFDINKSIDSGRLRPQNLVLTDYFTIGLYIFLALTFILVGVVFPTALIIKMINTDDFTGIWIISLFYIPGLLTAYGLINDNRLRRFKGKDLGTNKQIMISLIKDRYKSELIYEGEKMISYYARPNFWSFGTRVIVCFSQDNIFINISRFNQNGLKSFFHQPFIDGTVNTIIRDFNIKVRT